MLLLSRMRARDSVMPCAFQCVRAQANVKGNWLRFTSSSDAAPTECLKIGTHFRERSLPFLSGPKTMPGKKVRGTTFCRPSSPTSSVSSTPKLTSSNSTTTHKGACCSGRSALGSPPFGHTKPRTLPSAPFIRPASVHSLCVSSTRAPSHRCSMFGKPRNSSASILSAFTSPVSPLPG